MQPSASGRSDTAGSRSNGSSMVKKFVPVPDEIRTALAKSINERYRELISKLPDIGMSNPQISVESTANGFSGDVRFYNSEGGYSTSLWEYKTRDQRWYMYRDWND